METPDVPLALMRSCDEGGMHFDPMDTTYFASRETVVAGRRSGMPVWRDKLFAFMHRNAAPATGFFRIPGNRLVELASQVEISRPSPALLRRWIVVPPSSRIAAGKSAAHHGCQ